MVLDASGITFADSALLNLLILTHQAADFALGRPRAATEAAAAAHRVDTVLKIRETVDEAAAC